MMVPARLMQASAPLLFDLALTRFGTAALGLTVGVSLCSASMLLSIGGRPTDRA
jgi:hypothetical protein